MTDAVSIHTTAVLDHATGARGTGATMFKCHAWRTHEAETKAVSRTTPSDSSGSMKTWGNLSLRPGFVGVLITVSGVRFVRCCAGASTNCVDGDDLVCAMVCAHQIGIEVFQIRQHLEECFVLRRPVKDVNMDKGMLTFCIH